MFQRLKLTLACPKMGRIRSPPSIVSMLRRFLGIKLSWTYSIKQNLNYIHIISKRICVPSSLIFVQLTQGCILHQAPCNYIAREPQFSSHPLNLDCRPKNSFTDFDKTFHFYETSIWKLHNSGSARFRRIGKIKMAPLKRDLKKLLNVWNILPSIAAISVVNTSIMLIHSIFKLNKAQNGCCCGK